MAIQIGSVFKGYTDKSWTAKPKFIIAIKDAKRNDNVLCVFVNTNRPDIENLLEYHIPILASDHSWLSYDSFIGCSIPQEFTDIDFNGKVPVGQISDELLEQIIDKVRDSFEVPQGLLKSYF